MDKGQKVILHGVGKTSLIYGDGSILNVDKAQDFQFATTGNTGKQEGGDALYPLLEFNTGMTGKITMTDAQFSLNQAYFAAGGKITTGAEHNAQETVTAASGAATLKNKNVVVDSVIVNTADGTPLTRIATGTPTATQFVVTTDGKITVDATVTGSLLVDYVYTNVDGLNLAVMNDSVSQPCEMRHRIVTDEMPNGKRYQFSIRVFKARCNGNFTYDAKRGAAFSPKLEYEVMDSGRDDNRNYTYSMSEYTEA